MLYREMAELISQGVFISGVFREWGRESMRPQRVCNARCGFAQYFYTGRGPALDPHSGELAITGDALQLKKAYDRVLDQIVRATRPSGHPHHHRGGGQPAFTTARRSGDIRLMQIR